MSSELGISRKKEEQMISRENQFRGRDEKNLGNSGIILEKGKNP